MQKFGLLASAKTSGWCIASPVLMVSSDWPPAGFKTDWPLIILEVQCGGWEGTWLQPVNIEPFGLSCGRRRLSGEVPASRWKRACPSRVCKAFSSPENLCYRAADSFSQCLEYRAKYWSVKSLSFFKSPLKTPPSSNFFFFFLTAFSHPFLARFTSWVPFSW